MTSRRRHELESRSEAVASGGEQLWALAWTEGLGERTVDDLEAVQQIYGTPGSRLWIDVEDPTKDTIDRLGALLGVHPLVSEDILERNQRAKIEESRGALHIVMFALTYNGELVPHEIDLVLGERFLLTAHDKDINLRNAPFMRRDPGSHLAAGSDFALWMITDWLVDGYFPIFDKLGDEIDALEADILRRPGAWVVERLFAVRRDLLNVRHAVLPQREVFNQLTNRDLKLIHPDRIVYFRDVYDHLIRLTDELDSYRELVSTSLDIYLSQVNNNLSEVMKRLTSVTAILAGAGALAGIFGMSEAGLALSFEDMRFWFVTFGIVIASALGIIYFRRIGWI